MIHIKCTHCSVIFWVFLHGKCISVCTVFVVTGGTESSGQKDEAWVVDSDRDYTYEEVEIFFHYIPRRKSGIYWIQVRRAAAAAAVEISLWTR